MLLAFVVIDVVDVVVVVCWLAKQEGLVSIRINHKIIDDEVITNNKNDFRHITHTHTHTYTLAYTNIHTTPMPV